MAAADPHLPTPTEIKLHRKSRVLEITYADGKTLNLPCEFLRAYSPSAEVRGHGPGQEVLQPGKKDVTINRIEPVGTYAVQRYFSVRPRYRHLLVGAPLRLRREPAGHVVPLFATFAGSRRLPRKKITYAAPAREANPIAVCYAALTA